MNEERTLDPHDADDGSKARSADDTTERFCREHVAVHPLEFVGLKHVNGQSVG